jgi:hypothetical protein
MFFDLLYKFVFLHLLITFHLSLKKKSMSKNNSISLNAVDLLYKLVFYHLLSSFSSLYIGAVFK